MIKGLIAGTSVQECVAQATKLLDQVGLFLKKNQSIRAQLSGGQQQRVAISTRSHKSTGFFTCG